MDTTVCTILLDSYAPEHHLVAMDGRLMTVQDFQNLGAIRQRVYARPLGKGWGSLLSARGRAGYAVTIYGDAFERRYFEGVLRFHRANRDGTYGELTAKPLPEAVDPPLARRFAELDTALGQPPYLQRSIQVALFGAYATQAYRERLEQEVGEAMDAGMRAAQSHGLGVECVLAPTPEALAALAAEGTLGAVVARPDELSAVIGAQGVADGVRRALLAPGVTQGAPEMVNDAEEVGEAWFLWGLPDEAAVPGALADFLRHAYAKAHFRALLERADLPGDTVEAQARLARLGACRPMLLLAPPEEVERGGATRRALRWSVPWEEAFPEIKGGYVPRFTVHPGEESVAVEMVGDEAVWRGLDVYGTAEVACAWNGALDRRRFAVSCVPSTEVSTESRLRVADPWITRQWARAFLRDGRLVSVLCLAGTSVSLEPTWLNRHGERLSGEGMTWVIAPRAKRAHKALPTATFAAGRLMVEVPEAGRYDVTLSLGEQRLSVEVVVLPKPTGMGFDLRSNDAQTRIVRGGDGTRVRLCPGAALDIHAYYRYSEEDERLFAAIREECPSFDLDRAYAPNVGVADEAIGEVPPGELTHDASGTATWRLTAAAEACGKGDKTVYVTDTFVSATRLFTHKALPSVVFSVRVVPDWTRWFALGSAVATFVCLLCFRYADYGLDNGRVAVYLIAGGAQGILFLTRLVVNRMRAVQALGVSVILALFLYELIQELS